MTDLVLSMNVASICRNYIISLKIVGVAVKWQISKGHKETVACGQFL